MKIFSRPDSNSVPSSSIGVIPEKNGGSVIRENILDVRWQSVELDLENIFSVELEMFTSKETCVFILSYI